MSDYVFFAKCLETAKQNKDKIKRSKKLKQELTDIKWNVSRSYQNKNITKEQFMYFINEFDKLDPNMKKYI